ncbi:MAG: ParA family protein [Rhodomicrobium sp.]
MSGKVITIVNRKGGVGKTTLTLGLADTLVGETEQPSDTATALVVTVDLDPQASLTRALLYDRSGPVVWGRLKSAMDEGRTLASALKDRLRQAHPEPKEYLTHGVGPTGYTYSLLANEARAWDVERQALKKAGEAKLQAALQKILDGLANTYRYVLVDSPPGQTALAEAAIQRSDLVLCPIAPDYLSYWGLESFDEYLQELFENNGTRPPARFVFTKFKPKPPKYDPQDMISDLVNRFSAPQRYVTLLKEAGRESVIGGRPIALPFDPRLALRLEGAPRAGMRWRWDRIYTKNTQAELRRLALAIKKELDNG